MTKVSGRWLPSLLRQQDKSVRVQTSKRFLERFAREGERFSQGIITCDESLLYFYDPETKAESMVSKHTSSPPSKKAKVVMSAQKVMFLVCADHRGIILSHAVPTDQTINATFCQKVPYKVFVFLSFYF